MDGGFLLSGVTESFGAGSGDVYLVRTDSAGNLLWSKAYGSSLWDDGVASQASDGGYVIAGERNMSGSNWETYFIKTDSLGNSGCDETSAATIVNNSAIQVSVITPIYANSGSFNSYTSAAGNGGSVNTLCYSNIPTSVHQFPVQKNNISVFPNPANNRFTIYDVRGTIEKIEIYSAVGESVFQLQTTNCKQQTIDVTEWNAGVYFLRIKSGNEVQAEKISIVK
jgi:hypothetical protein